MAEPAVTAAIVATVVAVLLSAIASAIRYLFGFRLITRDEVDDKINEADAALKSRHNDICQRLDEQEEHLNHIEELIMGGEYQVSDGMLEIVELNRDSAEDQEERIEGLERIQLKIRRRQKEHSGGEPVARGEDLDPPPRLDDDEDNSDR